MTRSMALAAAFALVSLAAPQAQERGARPPPGDYFDSCRDISTYGYGRDATITAECRDDSGRWRRTRLPFAGCDRIHNRDGQLVCRGDFDRDRDRDRYGDRDRYPRPGGPPFGEGFAPGGRITLYSGPNFSGQPFEARREFTNLPREFNDRALSLRIDGRRPWQVCSDSDFRGRCQVFDRDVPDLRAVGMGFAISSMRPVRY